MVIMRCPSCRNAFLYVEPSTDSTRAKADTYSQEDRRIGAVLLARSALLVSGMQI